ncbi:MAG TPA: permease prefix domain 1-containing protein [Gemmatimonadales bacterium]|jgi:hypothetical protein|nr:permease prefix domain 1-containing protein [Gemmatimonadales bacterium]
MTFPGVRKLFRLIGRETPVEQEIDAEIQFHLEQEAARLVQTGLDPEAARAEARRRFGDLGRARAELEGIDRGRRVMQKRLSRLEDLRVDPLEALRSD